MPTVHCFPTPTPRDRPSATRWHCSLFVYFGVAQNSPLPPAVWSRQSCPQAIWPCEKEMLAKTNFGSRLALSNKIAATANWCLLESLMVIDDDFSEFSGWIQAALALWVVMYGGPRIDPNRVWFCLLSLAHPKLGLLGRGTGPLMGWEPAAAQPMRDREEDLKNLLSPLPCCLWLPAERAGS